jgi:hypothetical protein
LGSEGKRTARRAMAPKVRKMKRRIAANIAKLPELLRKTVD